MRSRLGVLVLLASGCAYYNGLYNANRLAREAERAERQGRTGEARSLWSQAAVKAESVVSRHPTSKYRDDALLLQGRALERTGSCIQAVEPLRMAADSSPDAALRVEARLLLGACRLQLREPDSAISAVAPVVASGSPAERSEAFLLRGRAMLLLGRDAEALDELAASATREAAFYQAIALTHLGRVDEAVDVLAAIPADPYDEGRWLPTLDTVGAERPGQIGTVVDALADAPERRTGERLRLWLQDGRRRLTDGDTLPAERRFVQVRALAPDSAEGRAARAYLAVFAAVRAASWSQVSLVLDSLNAALRQGGDAVRVGGMYSTVLARAYEGLDPDGSALGLFLAAEDVRDSVGNPVLAASLFEQLGELHGGSVLAPKALLALAALRPADADSLVGVMRARYPESPYTLLLAGLGGEAYEALEDSLARVVRESGRRRGGTEDGRSGDRQADGTRRVRN